FEKARSLRDPRDPQENHVAIEDDSFEISMSLESVLQRELQNSWPAGAGVDDAECIRIAERCSRIAAAQAVRDIEGFRAEFDRLSLANSELPRDSFVPLPESGPEHAECAEVLIRAGSRRCESRLVEVIRQRRSIAVRIGVDLI